jgi:hypothetical protein
VAEAGAYRKSVGPWELSVGTQIEWGTRWWTRFGAVLGRLSVGRAYVRKWQMANGLLWYMVRGTWYADMTEVLHVWA